MAKKKQESGPGVFMILALVFFVLTSIILGVTTYLGFKDADAAEKLAKEAVEKAKALALLAAAIKKAERETERAQAKQAAEDEKMRRATAAAAAVLARAEQKQAEAAERAEAKRVAAEDKARAETQAKEEAAARATEKKRLSEIGKAIAEFERGAHTKEEVSELIVEGKPFAEKLGHVHFDNHTRRDTASRVGNGDLEGDIVADQHLGRTGMLDGQQRTSRDGAHGGLSVEGELRDAADFAFLLRHYLQLNDLFVAGLHGP